MIWIFAPKCTKVNFWLWTRSWFWIFAAKLLFWKLNERSNLNFRAQILKILYGRVGVWWFAKCHISALNEIIIVHFTAASKVSWIFLDKILMNIFQMISSVQTKNFLALHTFSNTNSVKKEINSKDSQFCEWLWKIWNDLQFMTVRIFVRN